MIAHRKTLAIIAGGLLALILGAGILQATVFSPQVHAYRVCVDQQGNVRLLGDQLNGGSNTTCKSKEVLYEFASGQSLKDMEMSYEALEQIIQGLEATVADLQLQEGPAGPEGPQGLEGPAGPPGPEGPAADLAVLEAAVADLLALLSDLDGKVADLEAGVTATPTPGPAPDGQDILDILGATGVILPLVDSNGSFASSFDTLGATHATFSWNGLPFDTASGFQGSIPVVTFNGTNESASAPDATYWTGLGDGTAANEPSMSFGAWLFNLSARGSILTKFRSGATEAWGFSLNSSTIPLLLFSDESEASRIVSRQGLTALPANAWSFVVVTYAGTASHTGINIYVNGFAQNGTGSTGASYVALQNDTSPVELGSRDMHSNLFYTGDMAGGPLGPFFVHAELTAAQVLQLYNIGSTAVGN